MSEAASETSARQQGHMFLVRLCHKSEQATSPSFSALNGRPASQAKELRGSGSAVAIDASSGCEEWASDGDPSLAHVSFAEPGSSA